MTQPTNTTSTNTTTATTSKKSISFNERVIVRKAIHINDYTQKEVDRCWYNNEEYNTIRKNIRSTIMLMDAANHKVTDSETICRRGLESFTADGMAGRKSRRTKAQNAVFDEQDRQFMNSEEFDDETIAILYMKRSRASKEIAAIIGLIDERIVSLDEIIPSIAMRLASASSAASSSKKPLQSHREIVTTTTTKASRIMASAA